MIPPAGRDFMASFKEQRDLARSLREKRARADESLYHCRLDLFRTESLLRHAVRKETASPGPGIDIRQLHALQDEQIASRGKALKDLTGLTTDLQNAVAGIYVNPHPGEYLKDLDDSIPFLLFPVRIETRFVPAGAGTELWVRIYPDDIAVHTHEKLLSDGEVTGGTRYWKEIFNAEKQGGVDKDARKKSAWSDIVSLFGSQRAAWVAARMKPTNWSVDLSGIPTEADLIFPAQPVTRPGAWSRAPRTNVLPDKFVLLLYAPGAATAVEIPGPVIPDELVLGPDPLDAEGSFRTTDGNLAFGEAFDWTSDFDKAVSLGMGFKVTLSPAEASAGFDRILVLGVYLSADEAAGKTALETLIDNHHYSPKGFSITLQGTATNNTENDGSGYTRNDQFNDISYFVETGDPLFTSSDDCDGRNLADALGIEYDPLSYVMNSDGTDYRDAVDMNRALFPATLGYFLGTLLSPVLDDAAQDALRQFAVRHVTGRGPLPAIRVGDQPYGVLLTSDFSKWVSGKEDSLLEKMRSVIRHYQDLWVEASRNLQFVGKPGADPSDVLINVLGLQAASVQFQGRAGYSTDYLRNLDDFQYGGKYFADMQSSFSQKNEILNFLSGLGYDLQDASGNLRVPQALRLVYQHYATMLDAANLIDQVPLSEKAVIRYYDEANRKNYIHWLAESGTIDALENQDFGEGRPAPTTLLYLNLRRALLLELHRASAQWFKANGVDVDQTFRPANFMNIRPGGDLTKYEVMKATVGTAVPAHPMSTMSVAEYLMRVGGAESAAVYLEGMREALTALADLPTAKLERCFTEHLDVCTYRLDAWQSALFRSRLLEQRRIAPDAKREDRKKGVYLGAFGWLENIRPKSRTAVPADSVPAPVRPSGNQPVYEDADNGGYVHAPSLNQASAAAVLRSGYLSHADAGRPGAMAVNISSDRVRRALFMLQGIRNGQTLEALLGYQFERGMHDRGSADTALVRLNLYIYDLRDRFPIEQHQVRQQGSSLEPVVSLPPTDVVNGVTLAETTIAFPYGATGDVAAASPGEREAIEQEKDRLADTLDALKDLLLAESTYQMVQGNADRSGAVMNALRDGQIPPELDVMNTPRSTNFTFTNRVTVQFEDLDPALPGSNPWFPKEMTPRANLEPGLNRWLAGVIGAPSDIMFRVSQVDAGGNELASANMSLLDLSDAPVLLQPIDIVYIMGNELNTGSPGVDTEPKTAASELETMVAHQFRKLHSLGNDAIVRIEFLRPQIPGKRTLGEMLPMLRMLKSVVTDARHLHAGDFDPPSGAVQANQVNPQGYDAADIAARIQAAINAYTPLVAGLRQIPIAATFKDADGVLHSYAKLGELLAAMDAASVDIRDVTFTFDPPDAGHLIDILIKISAFGTPDAFPRLRSAATGAEESILLEQARSVCRRAAQSLDKAMSLAAGAAADADTGTKVAGYVSAGKALFGDLFNILPFFRYNNEADILQSDSDRAQLLAYASGTLKMNFPVDEWLQQAAHVRTKLARWDYIRMLSESFHDTMLELKPVQVPYRAGDSWLAVEFPDTYSVTDEITHQVMSEPFTIAHDTLSVTVHGDAAFVSGGRQSGLLIDDWTEVIPVNEEITGIAFNFDQPNSSPPQALLLAVTPEIKGFWTWADLVGTLNDTLARAKQRAVEPLLLDSVKKAELGVLLPAVVADFSQFDLNVSLDYRMNIREAALAIPIQTAAMRVP